MYKKRSKKGTTISHPSSDFFIFSCVLGGEITDLHIFVHGWFRIDFLTFNAAKQRLLIIIHK